MATVPTVLLNFCRETDCVAELSILHSYTLRSQTRQARQASRAPSVSQRYLPAFRKGCMVWMVVQANHTGTRATPATERAERAVIVAIVASEVVTGLTWRMETLETMPIRPYNTMRRLEVTSGLMDRNKSYPKKFQRILKHESTSNASMHLT